MLDDVRSFEFYYDSAHDEPREDPERIHARLEAVAEREGIAYERTDTAEMTDEERRTLYRETVSEVRAGREYHVGNRIFTGGTFGSLRPALVIRYADGEGVDVYPHRNDAVETRLVGVLDLLDEIEEGAESDHGDDAAPRARSGEEQAGDPASGEEPDDPASEADPGQGAGTGSSGIVAALKNSLPL